MKNKFSKHILVVFILVFLMLILIFLSSDKNTNLEIEFVDQINYIYNSKSLEIGSLYIENENFLPVRVKLNNYVLCNRENDLDVIELYYSESLNSESFMWEKYNKFIEIPSKNSKKLKLIMMYYYLPYNEEFTGNSETYYIYNVGYENYINSCSNFDPKDSIKEIKINFKNETNK